MFAHLLGKIVCLLFGHQPLVRAEGFWPAGYMDIHLTKVTVWVCPNCHKVFGLVDPHDLHEEKK